MDDFRSRLQRYLSEQRLAFSTFHRSLRWKAFVLQGRHWLSQPEQPHSNEGQLHPPKNSQPVRGSQPTAVRFGQVLVGTLLGVLAHSLFGLAAAQAETVVLGVVRNADNATHWSGER